MLGREPIWGEAPPLPIRPFAVTAEAVVDDELGHANIDWAADGLRRAVAKDMLLVVYRRGGNVSAEALKEFWRQECGLGPARIAGLSETDVRLTQVAA